MHMLLRARYERSGTDRAYAPTTTTTTILLLRQVEHWDVFRGSVSEIAHRVRDLLATYEYEQALALAKKAGGKLPKLPGEPALCVHCSALVQGRPAVLTERAVQCAVLTARMALPDTPDPAIVAMRKRMEAAAEASGYGDGAEGEEGRKEREEREREREREREARGDQEAMEAAVAPRYDPTLSAYAAPGTAAACGTNTAYGATPRLWY
eukprot:1176798-Rhodomonas_salina.2